MGKCGDFMAGMVVGGVAGALIGILFAPQSGKQTREEIARKADEMMIKAKEEYECAVEKTQKAYAATIQRLKELEETAVEKAEKTEAKVEELAGKGKDALQEGKGRLKKAIDAGVEAFKEEQGKTV